MYRTIEQWVEASYGNWDFVPWNEAISDLQELARQRDDLLAVLGSIIDLHDSASRGKQVAETIGKARAVIKKVRGGEC